MFGHFFISHAPSSALDEILHDPDTPLPWERRISLLSDVAMGMNYLHTLVPRVIHRDLKVERLRSALAFLLTSCAVRQRAGQQGLARCSDGFWPLGHQEWAHGPC